MGHQFVLTMMDYFSKYVETVPLKDKSAVSVAREIYEVYCRQGAPAHTSVIKSVTMRRRLCTLATA